MVVGFVKSITDVAIARGLIILAPRGSLVAFGIVGEQDSNLKIRNYETNEKTKYILRIFLH